MMDMKDAKHGEDERHRDYADRLKSGNRGNSADHQESGEQANSAGHQESGEQTNGSGHRESSLKPNGADHHEIDEQISRPGHRHDTRHGDHRDLIVWRKAMALATEIYTVTATFPRTETFGLTTQLRRAAVSIPSNLAEGSARRTSAEFMSFLHIARGSQAEIDTQLRLALALGYLPNEVVADLLAKVDEIGRLLTAVIQGVRRRQQR
jgi:four helix bundle protein